MNDSFCLENANKTCTGMGMGYGSSLPMSGYYHQMGPMSQVIIMMCGDESGAGGDDNGRSGLWYITVISCPDQW